MVRVGKVNIGFRICIFNSPVWTMTLAIIPAAASQKLDDFTPSITLKFHGDEYDI